MLSYHRPPTDPARQSPQEARVNCIRINVRTDSAAYPVLVQPGLLGALRGVLAEERFPGRAFVVSSPTVWRLHGTAIARALSGLEVVLIPDGEKAKTLQTVSRVYDALVTAQADRGAGIVAIGGGVIGDAAGFAAATYLRGISVAHVPTTLLAQVDSAVGGKVGVNHPLGKNLIGAFHQPRIVAVDPLLLATLPRREFRAGLYEVVKYGMAFDGALFERVRANASALFAREAGALSAIIEASCRIKAAVVQEDERERGPRRLLNFGHTAGHALEAITKYRRFRHGEAVALGMLVAADLAVARGALALEAREALAHLVAALGPLPPIADLRVDDALEAIRRDKKVVAGRLHFVMPVALGRATIVDDVEESELAEALARTGLRQ
jgi:3-dehydroquinate synthase